MALGGHSLRDRTADFNAITARLQKQAGVSASDSSSPLSSQHAAAKQAVQQQSEFARKASQIGLSIHKTSVKLQKLAQLAKRTSMFDDPTREIDEMTGIIKHDIQVRQLACAAGAAAWVDVQFPQKGRTAAVLTTKGKQHLCLHQGNIKHNIQAAAQLATLTAHRGMVHIGVVQHSMQGQCSHSRD
jgi:hypothetical protein